VPTESIVPPVRINPTLGKLLIANKFLVAVMLPCRGAPTLPGECLIGPP
jgi:hypothetical protein